MIDQQLIDKIKAIRDWFKPLDDLCKELETVLNLNANVVQLNADISTLTTISEAKEAELKDISKRLNDAREASSKELDEIQQSQQERITGLKQEVSRLEEHLSQLKQESVDFVEKTDKERSSRRTLWENEIAKLMALADQEQERLDKARRQLDEIGNLVKNG